MASTTALTSLAEIEESLRQISISDFTELKSYAKPPLAYLAIFEGIGVLLDPSKKAWEWTDDKKLMSGNKNDFLQRLFNFDKDNINNEQIERLKSILARNDCQPAHLASISTLCSKLGLWLQAILEYATQRQQSNQHIQAQTINLPRYLATLFALDENSVEIGQKATACVLAAAWCRHDHRLANNLLRHRRLFTLTEVFKAITMLDAARRIHVYEKQLKRLELCQTKPKVTKLGKIKK
ncbi:unnamed protein product [Rotaria sp. Silwood1]|nr:unnamed protein product [Rotaria sp. Silwood1]CAF3855147.1 unnamed protein product [Rotaria sp. Silwood1]CAF4651640.1 unnamed protein product [Rotaria sp. Silwood1]CAF4730344.1 unnamed protein product [Rotaria sp. Silwood1]